MHSVHRGDMHFKGHQPELRPLRSVTSPEYPIFTCPFNFIAKQSLFVLLLASRGRSINSGSFVSENIVKQAT